MSIELVIGATLFGGAMLSIGWAMGRAQRRAELMGIKGRITHLEIRQESDRLHLGEIEEDVRRLWSWQRTFVEDGK